MSNETVWTGDIRREYNLKRLSRRELDPDPIVQFDRWFKEGSPTVLEPNAMALSTVDAQDRPSSRMVLMKSFDHRGITFGTSYLSRKSEDAATNPHAALLYYWPGLERQIRVEGKMERTTDEESDQIFLGRSPGSRIAARAVSQSAPIGSREDLERMVRDEAGRWSNQEVTRPEFWGGFRVIPSNFEFWQGGRDRIHDRFLYTHSETGWTIERLQP